MLWAFLKAFHQLLVVRLQRDEYHSGHYGTPPSWRTWGKQLAVYVCSITLMKIVVLLIIGTFPSTIRAGDWLLSWLPNDDAQVAFVVMVWPLLGNALQFVVVDSLIKGKDISFSLLSTEDAEGGESDDSYKPVGSPAFPPQR